MTDVYVIGGQQTDFAVHWSRRGKTLFELMQANVQGAMEAARIAAEDIEVAHIGNFTGELFCGQGHLGGLFASIDPAFAGLPAARHEAACASGSMAVLAACAGIQAGYYDLACVVGIEQMRNVPGQTAADYLGAAAWVGREGQGARYLWPHMFATIADEYERRHGLQYQHLAAIARNNFDNARHNENAQTRRWTFTDASFTADDQANPVVEGRLRRHDCGQITDGAATVFLASERFARRHAERLGRTGADWPRLLGFGHRTGPMALADKLAASSDQPLMFPHVRGAVEDAWRRAGIDGVHAVDAIELHDCFTITEYVLLEHLGLAEPGQAWRAIEAGDITMSGRTPVNPSGGLIGLGHPVGATGVRMVLDAFKQVTGTAGGTQVDGARRVQTLNVGGSFTTIASFVVGYPD